jgi:hypothetical protein
MNWLGVMVSNTLFFTKIFPCTVHVELGIIQLEVIVQSYGLDDGWEDTYFDPTSEAQKDFKF